MSYLYTSSYTCVYLCITYGNTSKITQLRKMANNILFICSANKDRSRTAEIYFQNKYPELRFRSAGINEYLCKKHGGIYLERYMLDCARKIICMEAIHRSKIIERFGIEFDAKIEVLNLGDTETFMTKSLIELLEEKVMV